MLSVLVAGFSLIAWLLPGVWGRGGFPGGGTDLPGWFLVLGLPCNFLAWISRLAMYLSALWFWGEEYRAAFPTAYLNILPVSSELLMLQPGRYELRSGNHVWLAGW